MRSYRLATAPFLFLVYASASCAGVYTSDGFIETAHAPVVMGGIEFKRPESLHLLSENVAVTLAEIDKPSQVRMSYLLRNYDKEDFTTDITLALPPYLAYSKKLCEGDAVCDYDQVADVEDGLKVAVNTQGIALHKETRATAEVMTSRHDVTDLLRTYGLDMMDADAALKHWESLPESAQKELADAGAVERLNGIVTAQWTLYDTFHWRQTFPAGEHVTKIEVQYPPALGVDRYAGSLTNAEAFGYCIDDKTQHSVLQRYNRSKEEHDAGVHDAYWANKFKFGMYLTNEDDSWRGPMDSFHIAIEKPQDTLMSLCFDGLKKVSPTRWEGTRTNYTPEHELKIILYQP